MKLDLNLVHPSPRPARLGWVLLALGVLAVAWAGARYQHQAARLVAAESALASQATARPGAKPGKPARVETGALESGGRRALQTDWASLFARLESRQAKDIALLGLEAEAGRLRLEAEARSPAAMLVYLQGLENAGLTQVQLQNHTVEAGEGYTSVRFTATAAWGEGWAAMGGQP